MQNTRDTAGERWEVEMKARALLATVSLALAGVGGAALLGSSAGAQGTMSCPNFNDSDVGAVDPGMTGYLVVAVPRPN